MPHVRARVSEVIANRIRRSISNGRLGPGERLPAERELALRYKTSRVSVREAYRSLEESGLILIRRGAEGGAFIAEVDHRPVTRSLSLMLRLGKLSMEELTEARLIIEPPIARLAARRAVSADIEALRALLDRQAQAVKVREDPRRYNLQFHRLIAHAAKNLPLKIVMNSIADLTMEMIAGFDIAREARRHVAAFHERIFEVVRDHDEEAAYTLMRRHIRDVQLRLKKTLLTQMGTRKVRTYAR